jgi:ribosome-binding protein aMBF1 (putative translation factor)
MNKPKRHKSPIIQQLLENRSAAEFEKTKKRMLLAAKIADAIKAKGWNNGNLAQALDQHNSVISKWLSGTHNFTADTLFDIEMVLGIALINVGESKPKEIIQRFELTLSVKTEDVIPNEYMRSPEWEKSLHNHIALCGGMAATSVSTQVN